MAERAHGSATGGALGPALAGAINDYNKAIGAVVAAEEALADAQRSLAGARGRLAGLAAGARVTGARALVPVADDPGVPHGDMTDS